MAQIRPTVPTILPAVLARLVPIGTRTAVKKETKVYRYYYLRLDVRVFREVAGAWRIRALITTPDFSATPVLISARLTKRGRHIRGFMVDGPYQKFIEKYASGGYIGVLFVEVVEPEKESEALEKTGGERV
jgi:hypothetical protein